MLQDLQTAPIAGGPIRYADLGPRDATDVIVLVHGFPLGVGMWAPQVEALGDRRLIVPALPGYDNSAPLERPSIDGYARQVVALIEHLALPPVVAAGLSMGGYVVFGMLRQAAARVRAVVLADTRSGADSDESKAGRRTLLDLLAREGPPAVAREIIPKLIGPATRAERPQVEAALMALIERQPAATIAASTRALMDRPDATGQLAGIHLPALVIVGMEDALTPPAESERMHAALPDAALVRIPGAGHMSNMEQPGAFNQAVRAFLGRLSPV
jgi:3-oxoadipate enol-lactonase